MKRAMRQIAGVFAELEKHRLVSKLKSARDRKRARLRTRWPTLVTLMNGASRTARNRSKR
jgi:DNA invertase Pin-like site-specific DNA recombinase